MMSPAEAAAITEEPNWAQLFKDRGGSELGFENLLLEWRKWHHTICIIDGVERKKMAPSVDGVIALALLGVMPPRTLPLPLEYKCVHGHDRCDQMLPGPDCPYCEKTERRLFEEQIDDHMWLSVAARAWRIVGIEDCTLFLNSFGEEKQIDLNRANWEKHTEAAVAVLEAMRDKT